MRRTKVIRILTLGAFLVSSILSGCAQKATTDNESKTPTPANPNIILATTTSTQDSGLLEALLPEFERKTGYKVKTIAVGSGAALAMGENGEADVLLSHAPASEQKLVTTKAVINYNLVMHNDFILVGPSTDTAKVKDTKTAVDAFKAIASTKSIFISRGDDSGTHKTEKAIWDKAVLKPSGSSWYQESGTGMGQTLTIASDKNAYTFSDRATYLSAKKNLRLDILSEGDTALLNIYHVMQVNPEKWPKVNKDGAKAFVDFILDPQTQKTIGEFGKDKYGQALFFSDAGKADPGLAAK